MSHQLTSPIVKFVALSAADPKRDSFTWSRFCHANGDCCHRAVLSWMRGQWPTALSAGDHAAYSLHAALRQPEMTVPWKMPGNKRLMRLIFARIIPRIAPCRIAPPSRISRHLLEQHQLARQLFKTINRWPGLKRNKDDRAALWWMLPSLRHPVFYQEQRQHQSDLEMHQTTKKGNHQWHLA